MFKIIFTSNIMRAPNNVDLHRSITKLSSWYMRSFCTKKPESPRMKEFKKKLRERTPIEKLEELEEGKHPYQEKDPLKPFPNNVNPETGEIGGPRGPEPTRYESNKQLSVVLYNIAVEFNFCNSLHNTRQFLQDFIEIMLKLNARVKYSLMKGSKGFITCSTLKFIEGMKGKKEESERMKQFHEKLKLQPIPRVGPRERFVDLVLVQTDPKTGELIANSEEDPTKWGDWQNGGRVSDF